jgi:hypothetical protein
MNSINSVEFASEQRWLMNSESVGSVREGKSLGQTWCGQGWPRGRARCRHRHRRGSGACSWWLRERKRGVGRLGHEVS